MKWLYRNLYRKKKGFTLVELMVVIIILAILTAIAVPSYMALRNRARGTAAKAEMSSIATALELFNTDYDQYPPNDDFATVAAELEGTGTINDTNAYMKDVPLNDPWGAGSPYTYDGDANGTTYTLSCTGDSSLEITDGIANWD